MPTEDQQAAIRSTDGRPLPRYQSHKKVWALKIAAVERHPVTRVTTITPAEEGFEPFTVTPEWADKHQPQAGGYYVVYDDGYASWSPAKAFEEGYSQIDA